MNKKRKVNLCQFGNDHSKEEWHSCPYQIDVHDNKLFKCRCCKECEQACLGDI